MFVTNAREQGCPNWENISLGNNRSFWLKKGATDQKPNGLLFDGVVKKEIFKGTFTYHGDEPSSLKIIAQGKLKIVKEDGKTTLLFKGTIQYGDGKKLEGEFVDDQLVEGKKTKGDGTVHKGTFIEGKLVEGKIKKPDGTIFFPWKKVESKSNEFTGKMEKLNGIHREGTFNQKYQLIEGKFVDKDGTIYQGIFENGKLIRGEKTLPDGTRYKGKFEDEKLKMGTHSTKWKTEYQGVFNKYGSLVYGVESSAFQTKYIIEQTSYALQDKSENKFLEQEFETKYLEVFRNDPWLSENFWFPGCHRR